MFDLGQQIPLLAGGLCLLGSDSSRCTCGLSLGCRNLLRRTRRRLCSSGTLLLVRLCLLLPFSPLARQLMLEPMNETLCSLELRCVLLHLRSELHLESRSTLCSVSTEDFILSRGATR
jgi:hypothetical protein